MRNQSNNETIRQTNDIVLPSCA